MLSHKYPISDDDTSHYRADGTLMLSRMDSSRLLALWLKEPHVGRTLDEFVAEKMKGAPRR